MTQEEKELLLKDLCARLPYVVFMTNKKLQETYYPLSCDDLRDAMFDVEWDDVPYLRPMSSMTEGEKEEIAATIRVSGKANIVGDIMLDYKRDYIKISETTRLSDWLNAHHFDYRGLIEKGLSLEAPEGMY